MALLDIITKDSTNRSVTIKIVDSSDGTPETGVTSATSGLDLAYRREGGVEVSITESDLSALDDAHSDGGMLHIKGGDYRLDLPDAAFATGANHVDVIGVCTGMVVIGGRVRLTDLDVETAMQTTVTTIASDLVIVASDLVQVYSDTTIIASDLVLVYSDTTVIASDVVVVTTDIASLSTKQDSDMVVLDASHTKTQSDIVILDDFIDTEIATIISDIALLQVDLDTTTSDLVVLTTDVAALSTKQDSDMVVVAAAHTKTQSDVALVYSDTAIIVSDTTAMHTQTTTIASDLVIIASDLVQVYSDTTIIVSDTTAMHTQTTTIASDLVIVASDTAVIEAFGAPPSVSSILTTQMTEAYAADGAAPTLAQSLCLIQQMLGDFAISGTTLTVKKVDGTTTAATFTLDDGTNPTSITRAT